MRLSQPLQPEFHTDAPTLAAKYAMAEEKIQANILREFPVEDATYPMPILIEGAYYIGAWLECAPLEGLVYGRLFDFDVALGNHTLFFDTQFPDGQIPCWVRRGIRGHGQIQMVVPIARTAWEVYRLTGDSQFLAQAYQSCSRWDDWLSTYRDRQNVNLVEMFCVYDTGHDNSTRFTDFCAEFPHECPAPDAPELSASDRGDAKVCKPVPGMPWYAPDLSATLYGGRLALAEMAQEMGDSTAAGRWREKAEATRKAMMDLLFDPETACFYDRTANGEWNRIRCDSLTRVLCEGVVDQPLFEEIFSRHILDPNGFWPAYPLPSVAVNDPHYNFKPVNNWGGPSQALTALRAPRWFEPYGKPAEMAELARRWVTALEQAPDFPQQLNPHTGEASPDGGYAPAILAFFDYVARLHGIGVEGDEVHWNCRLPDGATHAEYSVQLPAGKAVLTTTRSGSTLRLGGEELASIVGTCRVVTDANGHIQRLVGTSLEAEDVVLNGTPLDSRLGPNESVAR
jgi:hypothetical protein